MDKVGVKINDRAIKPCHCVSSKGRTKVNPIHMGQFGVAQGWGGEGVGQKDPLPKICHTYPSVMKLDTIMPYLKKTQKYMNHVTHLLSSSDISIFFIGNQQILLYQKI